MSPTTSSGLRFCYKLKILIVCVRPLACYPYLVFHLVADEFVDIWRILHTCEDIPTAMGDRIGT